MEALMNQLIATVQGAGGSIAWEDLVESVAYPDRPKIVNALKLAKERGLLKRVIKYNAEAKANAHTVDYVGS